MRYMSEVEYEAQLKKIQEENASIKRMQALDAERNKTKKKFTKPPTSKVLLWVVVLFSLQIICFVEYSMLKYGDFSAAYALIGIPATIVPTVLGYFHKSQAENTQGGIVYETAMLANHTIENDDEEDDEDAVG